MVSTDTYSCPFQLMNRSIPFLSPCTCFDLIDYIKIKIYNSNNRQAIKFNCRKFLCHIEVTFEDYCIIQGMN